MTLVLQPNSSEMTPSGDVLTVWQEASQRLTEVGAAGLSKNQPPCGPHWARLVTIPRSMAMAGLPVGLKRTLTRIGSSICPDGEGGMAKLQASFAACIWTALKA